jgi:hypothetical protein
MKNFFKIMGLGVVVLGASVLLCACFFGGSKSTPQNLALPTNIKVVERTVANDNVWHDGYFLGKGSFLTWDAVPGATEYIVEGWKDGRYTGYNYDTDTSEIALSKWDIGNYTFKIRAYQYNVPYGYPDRKIKDSSKVADFDYNWEGIQLPTPENLGIRSMGGGWYGLDTLERYSAFSGVYWEVKVGENGTSTFAYELYTETLAEILKEYRGQEVTVFVRTTPYSSASTSINSASYRYLRASNWAQLKMKLLPHVTNVQYDSVNKKITYDMPKPMYYTYFTNWNDGDYSSNVECKIYDDEQVYEEFGWVSTGSIEVGDRYAIWERDADGNASVVDYGYYEVGKTYKVDILVYLTLEWYENPDNAPKDGEPILVTSRYGIPYTFTFEY